MKILETERLTLRLQTTDDADFILELMNDPSWLQFIGDRGLRTVEDACEYIENGPTRMYEQFGFCLYLVERKEDQTPVGICGLVKRESLEDVDIGFAFLPKYWGKGYAYEAASATLAYGIDILGLNRIVAITTQDNDASVKLLEKVGLKFDRLVQFSNDAEELRLFSFNNHLNYDESKGEHVNIREANELDYPELRIIYLESRRKNFHWAALEEMTLDDFDKDTIGEHVIVAEEDNHLLGFVSLYLPDNFIHNLFIHPNFLGKGVGGHLLNASIKKMNKPLRLKCVSENHKALKFYEKNGWKKVNEEGEKEKYWVMIYE